MQSKRNSRFSRAGRTHHIDSPDAAPVEPASVLLRQPVVLGKDIVFQANHRPVLVFVGMFVVMGVLMRMFMALRVQMNMVARLQVRQCDPGSFNASAVRVCGRSFHSSPRTGCAMATAQTEP